MYLSNAIKDAPCPLSFSYKLELDLEPSLHGHRSYFKSKVELINYN